MATLNALTRKYLKLSKTELREELGRRGLIGFRYRFYPTAAEVVIEDEYSMAMLIAKDDQKNHPPFPFLRLPPELREEVYRYLCPTLINPSHPNGLERDSIFSYWDGCFADVGQNNTQQIGQPGLMRTCRKTRIEGLPFWFAQRKSQFFFLDAGAGPDFAMVWYDWLRKLDVDVVRKTKGKGVDVVCHLSYDAANYRGTDLPKALEKYKRDRYGLQKLLQFVLRGEGEPAGPKGQKKTGGSVTWRFAQGIKFSYIADEVAALGENTLFKANKTQIRFVPQRTPKSRMQDCVVTNMEEMDEWTLRGHKGHRPWLPFLPVVESVIIEPLGAEMEEVKKVTSKQEAEDHESVP